MDKNVVLCIASLWPSRKNQNSATQLVQQISARSKFCKLIVLAPHNAFRSKKIWLEKCTPKPFAFVSPTFLGVPMGGTKLIVLRNLLNELLFAAFMLPVILYYKVKWNVQIIHFHGDRGYLILAPAAKKMFRVSVVLTSHGISHNIDFRSSGATLNKISASAMNNIDRIIIVGEPLREHLLNLGVEGARITKIQNGHDSDTAVPSIVAEIADRYRGKFIIVSVARMVNWKGLEINLKALSRVNAAIGRERWVYLHVGDGPDRAKLQALTDKLGLENNVHFLGHLSYEAAMSVVASGDLFVLPSWGEAFGIVYLEAMARGVPAIGCKGAGAEESVVHAETGFLVDAQDSQGLADLILRVIENPALRERIASSARQHAAFFTWERNAERYTQLYTQLMHGGHRTS